jgi:hypothetical protein
MFKLEARIEGENIIISKKSWNYLLAARRKELQIVHLGGKIWDRLQGKISAFFDQCEELK